MNHDNTLRAAVRVGYGRGFAAQGKLCRFIITAAHCLPFFPPCISASGLHKERTYPNLLAPLGGEPAVWAECCFVDPIADITVLGPPDDQEQELSEAAEAYDDLAERLKPIELSDAPNQCRAWLLSLDNAWLSCMASHNGVGFWLSNAASGIRGGMSGSPIVTDDGAAIGVVCLSSGTNLDTDQNTEGGPNLPLLTHLAGMVVAANPTT